LPVLPNDPSICAIFLNNQSPSARASFDAVFKCLANTQLTGVYDKRAFKRAYDLTHIFISEEPDAFTSVILLVLLFIEAQNSRGASSSSGPSMLTPDMLLAEMVGLARKISLFDPLNVYGESKMDESKTVLEDARLGLIRSVAFVVAILSFFTEFANRHSMEDMLAAPKLLRVHPRDKDRVGNRLYWMALTISWLHQFTDYVVPDPLDNDDSADIYGHGVIIKKEDFREVEKRDKAYIQSFISLFAAEGGLWDDYFLACVHWWTIIVSEIWVTPLAKPEILLSIAEKMVEHLPLAFDPSGPSITNPMIAHFAASAAQVFAQLSKWPQFRQRCLDGLRSLERSLTSLNLAFETANAAVNGVEVPSSGRSSILSLDSAVSNYISRHKAALENDSASSPLPTAAMTSLTREEEQDPIAVAAAAAAQAARAAITGSSIHMPDGDSGSGAVISMGDRITAAAMAAAREAVARMTANGVVVEPKFDGKELSGKGYFYSVMRE
jgi:hypothetical protein